MHPQHLLQLTASQDQDSVKGLALGGLSSSPGKKGGKGGSAYDVSEVEEEEDMTEEELIEFLKAQVRSCPLSKARQGGPVPPCTVLLHSGVWAPFLLGSVQALARTLLIKPLHFLVAVSLCLLTIL